MPSGEIRVYRDYRDIKWNAICPNFYLKNKNPILIENGWSDVKTLLFALKFDQKTIFSLKSEKKTCYFPSKMFCVSKERA